MHYYELHIADYTLATMHLDFDEQGIYMRMLNKCYESAKALPADFEKLCRLICARTKRIKQKTKTILEEFFYLAEDGWRNKRCDEELKKFSEKSEKAKSSATKRWLNHKDEDLSTEIHAEKGDAEKYDRNAIALLTNNQQPISNIQYPNTNTTKENIKRKKEEKLSTATTLIEKPDDVDERIWLDFVNLRKIKKAPVTETVLARLRTESAKADISLNDALSTCCLRGWQGFEADWLDKKQNNSLYMTEKERRRERERAIYRVPPPEERQPAVQRM